MALNHAKAGDLVDLRPLGATLGNAKSTALVKSGQFEAIRLIVHAGAKIPPHDVPGNITLHCLEGRVELDLDTTSINMKRDEWVYLDGGQIHSITGIEDSCLLLTIIFDPSAQRP